MVSTDYFIRDEVDIVAPLCDVSWLIEAIYRDEAKLLIPSSRRESVDLSVVAGLLKIAREGAAVMRRLPTVNASEMAQREGGTSPVIGLFEEGRAVAS